MNRSTGIENTREGLKRARQLANQIQEKLDAEKEQADKLGIRKVTLQSAFDHFLRNNNDKHPHTITEYKSFFARLIKKFNPQLACTQLNKLSTEEWVTEIKELPLQRNSKYVIIKNLKKFLGFLFEYNYVPFFKLNKDVLVRPEVKDIVIFSPSDIDKIFAGLKNKNSNFRTLIYLLFYTGLRPSDLYKLTVEQINISKNIISYYSEKTKEYRMIPFHKDIKCILADRIKEVKAGFLFEYETVDNIGKAFRRYLDQLKLKGKNYNLRTFRKSFISYAYDNNIDLATVSKLVGHHNILTTAKYYNKITISRQTQELDKFKVPVIH